MEHIIELTKFFSKREIHDIQPWKKNSKYDTLFRLILEEKLKTIDSAMETLGFSDKNKGSFDKLIQRYERKLCNAIFAINTEKEDVSLYNKLNFSAYRVFMIAKVLRQKAFYDLSAVYLKKALKKGLNLGATELNLISSAELMQYYSFVKTNLDKSLHYGKIHEEQTNILLSEIKVNNQMIELQKYFTIEKDREKLILKSSSFIPELERLMKKHNSFFLQLHGYRLLMIDASLRKNQTQAIEYSKTALEYFSKKYKSSVPLEIFNKAIAENYLTLKDFKNALSFFEQSLSHSKDNSFRQLLLLGNLFTVYSHTQEYNKLFQTTYGALSKSIIDRYAQLKQSWIIKEAYVQFLAELGYVDQEIIDATPHKKFRLGKFMNEVPLYSADKKGANVSILIIQLLWLIKDKKYNQVIDKLESLTQYTYRYLKKDETFRYNCFIKMLLKIPKGNFHPFLTQKHADKLHKQLMATESKLVEFAIEVELIPFEDLWEITMKMLEDNK